MYSNVIMEEFYNPENYGAMRGANGVGKVTLDQANEIIKIYILVEHDIIKEATFQAFGGVLPIASSSIMVKLILGKTLKEVSEINKAKFLENLGNIPENKNYIIDAVLACKNKAIENYYSKN